MFTLSLTTILALVALLMQIVYWLFFRFSLTKPKSAILPQKVTDPVSVIICAHDELYNLQSNLEHIFLQDYENFEIVIVLDSCTDGSKSYLDSLPIENLTILEINDTKPGKKEALSYGISQAKHKWVLLTDADCKPHSDQWISSMMAHGMGEDAVLGFGPVLSKHPSLLSDFVQYETIQTGLLYLSAANEGHPYMAVGRNLLYKKSLFYESDGFESHEHIVSGDDDLFVQSWDKGVDCAVNMDPSSHMTSPAPQSWSEAKRQKSRHLSTGELYSLESRIYLGVYILSGILFWVAVLMKFAIWLVLFRIVIMEIILAQLFRKMGLTRQGVRLIWLDLLYYIYWIVSPLILSSRSPKEWK